MRQRLGRLLEAYQGRFAVKVRVLFALVWAVLIWVMSSRRGAGLPSGAMFSFVANAAHVVLFGVLSALVLLATEGRMAVRFRLAVFVAVFYGAVDEMHQSFVPGRAMDLFDLCTDAAAACLFGCLVWWASTGERGPRLWLAPCALLAAASVFMASR